MRACKAKPCTDLVLSSIYKISMSTPKPHWFDGLISSDLIRYFLIFLIVSYGQKMISGITRRPYYPLNGAKYATDDALHMDHSGLMPLHGGGILVGKTHSRIENAYIYIYI